MTKESKFHIGQGVRVTKEPMLGIEGRIQFLKEAAAGLDIVADTRTELRGDKQVRIYGVTGPFWIALEDLEVLKTE
jgi:hypothetical protein